MCDGPHLEVGSQYLMYTLQLLTGAIPAGVALAVAQLNTRMKS